MSTWVPDFYPAFRCRAAACLHSCCRDWEIDVDEASAAYYRQLPGELGDALRAALCSSTSISQPRQQLWRQRSARQRKAG